MTSHIHAINPAQADHARFEGAGARKNVAIGWLSDRLMDAWSRRVARAYADARLGEVATGDLRMIRELQAVASHQREDDWAAGDNTLERTIRATQFNH